MHNSSPTENNNQGISKHSLHGIKRESQSFSLDVYLALGRVRERAIYLIETGVIEFDSDSDRFKVQRQPAGKRKFLQKWEKWTIWNRADRLCNYCHKSKPLVVEHIIPFTAWPEAYAWLADDASNLTMSCGKCNKKKSNHFWAAGKAKNPLSSECEWCFDTKGFREGNFSCNHENEAGIYCPACSTCQHGSCRSVMSTCMKCCMDEYSPKCRVPLLGASHE